MKNNGNNSNTASLFWWGGERLHETKILFKQRASSKAEQLFPNLPKFITFKESSQPQNFMERILMAFKNQNQRFLT